MKCNPSRWAVAIPVLTLVAGAVALALWLVGNTRPAADLRLPGTDLPPGVEAASALDPVLAGKLITGGAQTEAIEGNWPQFRGPGRDGINTEAKSLAHSWNSAGPREIWAVDCGEGYAGAAVQAGRVYLMDYDAAKKQSALRCLSLADGRELWRYAYPLSLKRNHGVTRTVPAVSDKYVVAMDSKCNVLCLEATNGQLRWGLNLVREFGATIPPWYTGQCPLIDGSAVILAPGGKDALLLAVDLETGKPLWRAPNPRGWKMTHSSVMPMEFAGQRFYVYCGNGGVAGVSATNGKVLWDTTAWKISIATIASPLVLDGGRIFLCGGYNAGSEMLQLRNDTGKLVPQIVFKLSPEEFGATQHTPVLHDGHLFGVRPNGQFVCLDLDGKVRWTSPAGEGFGLGGFLLADGLFFMMNDSGRLTLAEGSTNGWQPLARAQVLKGSESWAPPALVNGRLIVRDFTRLVCLNVAAP
jgi:outer membrane protein assembly factor BamB